MYQFRRCARSLVFVLFVAHTQGSLAAGVTAKPVTVADEQEAKRHFEKAVELYKSEQYAASLTELLRTRELLRSYEVLYNIGQVRTLLKDPIGALQAYRQYLDEGGTSIPSSQRDEVLNEIRGLETQVATLSVEADRPGAEIYVDGVLSGAVPLPEPLLLTAGAHAIEVRLPSGATQTRQVTLTGARTDRVAFNFGGATKPPDPAAGSIKEHQDASSQGALQLSTRNTPQPEHRGSWLDGETARWAAWTGTGVLAAGAVVTGIIALSASSRLVDLRKQPESARDYPAMESESRRTKTFAGVTDGLTIAAILTGSAALWLTLRSHDASTNAGATDSPSIALGAGPSSIQLHGEF
ncbi:MAG: PEGA domain-containing protein [Myxococcales bacterium]